MYTNKKEKKIFHICKEIQSGAVAKSYMRKGFLIYSMRKCENISPYMRRPLVLHDFATAPLNFLIFEEKFIFFVISVDEHL
jgi:hypothetical protein